MDIEASTKRLKLQETTHGAISRRATIMLLDISQLNNTTHHTYIYIKAYTYALT